MGGGIDSSLLCSLVFPLFADPTAGLENKFQLPCFKFHDHIVSHVWPQNPICNHALTIMRFIWAFSVRF